MKTASRMLVYGLLVGLLAAGRATTQAQAQAVASQHLSPTLVSVFSIFSRETGSDGGSPDFFGVLRLRPAQRTRPTSLRMTTFSSGEEQANADVSTRPSDSAAVILSRDQASAAMPATVFYRGRTASVQARNSAGLRVSGDRLVLVAAVDTSGYSSSVQESYQDYLLTEVPLQLGGRLLAPGAYGVGFTSGDRFTALDLGGHALFTVASARDAALPRPNPLQILADAGAPGHFRLYSGRSYVTLTLENP